MQTIESERQLLADPDPVAPLCDKLTQLLRENLTTLHARYEKIHREGMAGLEHSDAWSKLADDQRRSVLEAERSGDRARRQSRHRGGGSSPAWGR